jgi:hypothetical protein
MEEKYYDVFVLCPDGATGFRYPVFLTSYSFSYPTVSYGLVKSPGELKETLEKKYGKGNVSVVEHR